MSYFEHAQVGDKVWSLELGYGTIIKIVEEDYPIKVKFCNNYQRSYTKHGKTVSAFNQTLFYDKIEFEIPKPEKNIEPTDGEYEVLAPDEREKDFGVRFETIEEANEAQEEMRKLNRLRKFMWDAQKRIEPTADEEDKTYIVAAVDDNSFIAAKTIISLLPKATKKVAEYVAKCLNNGTMKL